MATVSGFSAQDEKGNAVNCDAHGNNVAFQCNCGRPVLAVILANQKGYDISHPTECPGCGARYWVTANTVGRTLTIHSIAIT